jgi:hypothetical protein
MFIDFQKGECYACLSEKADHLEIFGFNAGVIVTRAARAGGMSSALTLPRCECRPGLDRTSHA